MTVNACRPCPVCEKYTVEVLHRMDFQLPKSSPLPNSYQIVSCQSCGMIYADSESTQANYDRYYAQFSKYEDPKIASGGGYSDTDRQRLEKTAAVIKKYLKNTDAVLDIGCANGGLLDALHKFGFEALTGIDPSSFSIENIKQKGYNGYRANISNLSAGNVGLYNGIILSHVLEHIFDVKAAMEVIKSLLEDHGLLYIEVPNARQYGNHYVVPYYYFDSEHINHFDINTLNELARYNGFEVMEWSETLISVTNEVNYPAVYVMLKKSDSIKYVNLPPSDELKSSILNFINQSEQDHRQKKIEYYSNSKEPLILWGAGSYTQRLMATSKLSECNIIAIVDNDNNKQDLFINTLQIKAPSILHNMEGTILILSALHSNEIKNEISRMGLKNKTDIIL